VCACACACACVCVRVCNICIIYVDMYIRMYIYMRPSMYACMYVLYIYTYIGRIVSMGVPSDGSYGIEPGLIYSFPLVCMPGGTYKIVQVHKSVKRDLIHSQKKPTIHGIPDLQDCSESAR
jgi:hypothetical protein